MAEVPAQPQPTSQGINWKNILIGAVIGAVLLGLGILVYLSYQPKSTSSSVEEVTNWKTHTNTKYGYSIKYPSDWLAKDMTKEIANQLIVDALYLNDGSQIGLGNKKITLTVQSVNNTSFIEQVKVGEPLSGEVGYDTEYSVAVVDGKEIVKGVIKQVSTDSSTNQLIEKEVRYEIVIPLGETTLFIDSETDEKHTVDLMLSTFKFLD